MHTTIWKFPVVVDDEQTVEMPKGTELLSVQVQHGRVWLWGKVDPTAPTVRRAIAVRGTGHVLNLRPLDAYVGTFQLVGGDFVGHVFDRGEEH